MYTPAQLRMLRIAVIAMGVILLLGFATVIGRIVYLFNAAPPSAPASPPSASDMAAPLKAPASIDLPKGAIIKHLAISDNRIAIHFEAPSGAGIRIVDLVTPQRSITLPVVEVP
ncbi:MAG: DUF6476 family protein [Hyphomicrobiaceae bacterium]